MKSLKHLFFIKQLDVLVVLHSQDILVQSELNSFKSYDIFFEKLWKCFRISQDIDVLSQYFNDGANIWKSQVRFQIIYLIEDLRHFLDDFNVITIQFNFSFLEVYFTFELLLLFVHYSFDNRKDCTFVHHVVCNRFMMFSIYLKTLVRLQVFQDLNHLLQVLFKLAFFFTYRTAFEKSEEYIFHYVKTGFCLRFLSRNH